MKKVGLFILAVIAIPVFICIGYFSAQVLWPNDPITEVVVPTPTPKVPSGASARCRDGSYSYSLSRQGTCSHHGGVRTWY